MPPNMPRPPAPNGYCAVLTIEEILEKPGRILADFALDSAAGHQGNRWKQDKPEAAAPMIPGMIAQVKPPQI